MHPVRLLLPMFALAGQTLAQAPAPTKIPRAPVETVPAKVAPAAIDKQAPATNAAPAAATATAAPQRKDQLPTNSRLMALPTTVVHDTTADGTLWAHGSTWKGSFAAGSFTYIPFLGSDAPQNFPPKSAFLV